LASLKRNKGQQEKEQKVGGADKYIQIYISKFPT
jgi:hypothetical protein